MNRQIKGFAAALFILWAFFVLASFYAVQKPFTAANGAAAARVLLDLLAAGWLALLALGLGSRLLQQFFFAAGAPQNRMGPETVLFGAGLGLGLLGLLGLGLGLAGLLRPVVAYGLAVALSLALGPHTVRLGQDVWPGVKAAFRLPPAALLPAVVYVALICLLTLAVALLPPTDWDGLFYHLTGPRLYVQAGQLAGNINIPHLSFPSLMEMLFTWAILLRGDVAAKLLHTLFGFLTGGLVFLTSRRFFGPKAAWPALLVFTSMPMVSTLAGWAYNDLALAFYQLAALYWFIEWSTGRNTNFKIVGAPLILSGIFAGLAMGMKYTAFVTPLVVVGLIVWSLARRPRRNSPAPGWRALPAAVAIFAGSALVVAAPWYIKNWLFTGNPVYPFLFNLFGGRFWDSFRADWYAAAGTGIGLEPKTLLALPWLLTLGVRDANYWDGRTGPLLLLFLPAVLVYRFVAARRSANRPAAMDPLLIFVLVQFVFWAAGVVWSQSLWQSRLLLSGLAALAPVTGLVWAGMSRLDLPRFSTGRFIHLAVGLVLALTLIDAGLLALKINPMPYLAGLETRDQYLTRRLGAHYTAMQQINHTLAPDSVVVFLWEPRSYYCRLNCLPDSILDAFPYLVNRYGSPRAIARAWQEAGVTHVLVHRAGLNFVLGQSPQTINTTVLAELENGWLQPVFEVGSAYQLYALEPGP